MEENKSQNPAATPDGIVVKDFEGRLKVLSDGELKDIDVLLSSTEHGSSARVPDSASQKRTDVSFPAFTDLAKIPEHEHFEQKPSEPKPGIPADFHFHPDDKEEIEQELEKLTTAYDLQPQKQYSIHKITQKLIDKHNLRFSEQEFIACVKALLSYFRQTRSLVETRALLVRQKQEGGLGVAPDTADHMLAVLKHLKQKIEELDGIVVEAREQELKNQPAPAPQPAPQKEALQEVRPRVFGDRPELRPFDRRTEEKTPDVSLPVQERVVFEKKIPASPVPVARDAGSVDRPALETRPEAKPRPSIPQSPLPAAEVLPKVVRPDIPTFKPPLVEVKKPQANAVRAGRPIGRVEELALMDMTTWRMLDPDPRIRAGKILGKIQNLEQESLTRKSQGIQAWRSNEVYQHYLMLGQTSLEQKKDVAEVIRAIKAQGQETLTLEEFDAISDLNRMLRF